MCTYIVFVDRCMKVLLLGVFLFFNTCICSQFFIWFHLFSEAVFDFKQYAVLPHHTTLPSLRSFTNRTSIKKVDSPLMNSSLIILHNSRRWWIPSMVGMTGSCYHPIIGVQSGTLWLFLRCNLPPRFCGWRLEFFLFITLVGI